MPRKSHFHAIEPDLHPGTTLLLPPDDASPTVAGAFREIVAAAGADHFRPGDVHLIEMYASAVVLARRAHTELERSPSPKWLNVYEKTLRQSGVLAARLRLAPQQRLNARSAARTKHRPPDAYELMRASNGHA